jgi:hypothetical protein
MSYRDDHDAALLRAEAAERDASILADANRQLAADLVQAREWLGGPRRRALALVVLFAAGALAMAVGIAIGRTTAPEPSAPELRRPTPLPSTSGALVLDGPMLGHSTMIATRCAARFDGSVDICSDAGILHVSGDGLTLDVADLHVLLTRERCYLARDASVVQGVGLSGHVTLDCIFEGNRLAGRVDFLHCR